MENNIGEKFLPIGSIVLLKGGTKKAMITGFCSIAEEDKTKMYDYMGCVYPEGYLDFNQVCLFDHDQIEKIFHYGYVDEEEQEFKKELKEVSMEFENDDEEMKTLIENFDLEDDIDDDDSDDEDNDGEVVEDIPVIELDEAPKEASIDSIEELEYL